MSEMMYVITALSDANGDCKILHSACPYDDNNENPCEKCSLFKEYKKAEEMSANLVALECCRTKDIVRELISREGVEAEYAEPHQDKTITVNGPAIILVVTD